MFLVFEIVDLFAEIEPDHRVTGTMPLRLRFVAKGGEGYRDRIERTGCEEERRQRADRGQKRDPDGLRSPAGAFGRPQSGFGRILTISTRKVQEFAKRPAINHLNQ